MNRAERSQLLQILHARRDAIARRWYRAIAHTSFVPLDTPDVRQRLGALADEVITLLLAEPFDCHPAQSIGGALARLHFVKPAALGKTHTVLAHELVAGLPADLAVALHPRLIALLSELATGFVKQVRITVLAEQEQIHRALFTELKRVEAIRCQSETRFRAIFEGAAIGIALADMEGRPVESNSTLQDMLGYSGEELRSMVFTEFTHPDDVAVDLDLYAELVAGERDHYQMEKRYIRKNGRVIWGRLTVSLVQHVEGNLRYTIGMVEDISERKQIESELAAAQRRLAESERSRFIDRELAMLRLLVSGKTNQEIGQELGIAERTVRYDLRKIYAKLGAKNRIAAAMRALQLGLV